MKKAISLTTAAEQHINQILKNSEQKVFLVSIDNKGCSGHSYVYELCNREQLGKFDETIDLEDGFLAIKSNSVMKLLGSTLGLENNEFGQQFVWTNPQVSGTCGCGKSVSF